MDCTAEGSEKDESHDQPEGLAALSLKDLL